LFQMRHNGLDHVQAGYLQDGGSCFSTKQGIKAERHPIAPTY